MTDPSAPTLAPRISGLLATFYALGTILGAGIYVLVGKVAAEAGLLAPLAFALAAGVAALTGLAYAELAARFPRAAGAALYVQQGFGRRRLTQLAGLLVLTTGVVSAATLANGFAGYLAVWIDLPDAGVTTALIVALGLIAAWGVAESVTLAALITLVELGGLLLIIAVTGETSLARLPDAWPTLLPGADLLALGGILSGAFLAFYAYIGFEDTANLAEEVRAPQKNVPRAILWSLAIATVLYLVVALVAVLGLPLETLTTSRAPLADLYTAATGRAPTVISLISLVAVINGALIQIIMGSRLLYGMAREGWLPRPLAQLHPQRRTPLVSTALITAIILLLAFLPLVSLAKFTSFVILLVFAALHVALLRIKRRVPHPPGVRVYPRIIPAAGLLATLGLLAWQVRTLLAV
jgi:amino acid transporter